MLSLFQSNAFISLPSSHSFSFFYSFSSLFFLSFSLYFCFYLYLSQCYSSSLCYSLSLSYFFQISVEAFIQTFFPLLPLQLGTFGFVIVLKKAERTNVSSFSASATPLTSSFASTAVTATTTIFYTCTRRRRSRLRRQNVKRQQYRRQNFVYKQSRLCY